MNVRATFCSVAFLAVAVSARGGQIDWGGGGELLVDHEPHRFGGLTSDSMGFASPGSSIVYQYVADDFTLPAATQFRRIVFWGFYNSNLFPSGDETMRVRLYDARPGDTLPGEILYEESFLNVPREWTGQNVIAAGGGQELRFELFLEQAFDVIQNSKYWLEIAQIGDPACSFRWEDSVNGSPNGVAFNNLAFPNWRLTDYPIINPNAAFQLYAIPEPTALSLLVVGGMTLGFSRRRRWQLPSPNTMIGGQGGPGRVFLVHQSAVC